jgi:hypothetical protein
VVGPDQHGGPPLVAENRAVEALECLGVRDRTLSCLISSVRL